MTDETQPVPTIEPVPEAPAVADAEGAPEVPMVAEAEAAPEGSAAAASRRSRVLGMTAQVAGVIGIVVCLALVVGVVLARGWAVDKVDAVAGKVDSTIARGVPLLDTASTKVTDVSARVGLVIDAARARAADPGPALVLVQTMQLAMAGVSERYLELRTTYADARETLVSVSDRLNTVDAIVPFIDIPEGAGDKLVELDARARELDARVMDVINADIGSGQAAAAIADKAGTVEAALQAVSTRLDEAEVRLGEVRAEVAATADQVRTIITILSIVLILVLCYLAFLHWVLFRQGRTMRRGGEGA